MCAWFLGSCRELFVLLLQTRINLAKPRLSKNRVSAQFPVSVLRKVTTEEERSCALKSASQAGVVCVQGLDSHTDV